MQREPTYTAPEHEDTAPIISPTIRYYLSPSMAYIVQEWVDHKQAIVGNVECVILILTTDGEPVIGVRYHTGVWDLLRFSERYSPHSVLEPL